MTEEEGGKREREEEMGTISSDFLLGESESDDFIINNSHDNDDFINNNSHDDDFIFNNSHDDDDFIYGDEERFINEEGDNVVVDSKELLGGEGERKKKNFSNTLYFICTDGM